MGLGLCYRSLWHECHSLLKLNLSLLFYGIHLIRILIATAQLWSLATTTVQVRLRIQLNSILFAKSLVRKDVASSSPHSTHNHGGNGAGSDVGSEKKGDEDDFSSKAQVMTLMTTDVDRVSEFGWHAFTLVGMLHWLNMKD